MLQSALLSGREEGRARNPGAEYAKLKGRMPATEAQNMQNPGAERLKARGVMRHPRRQFGAALIVYLKRKAYVT